MKLQVIKKGYRIWRQLGTKVFLKKIFRFVKRRIFKLGDFYNYDMNYRKWISEEGLSSKSVNSKLVYQPLISVIVPVYNVPDKWLTKCIDSILSQSYSKLELILIDDKSTKYNSKKIIQDYSVIDKRVRYKFNEVNLHISESTNVGLNIANGEFVTFVDNDDEISIDALSRFIELLNEYPDTSFAYSDEDLINEKEERINPVFKPDWSPYLSLSEMYTTHMAFYKTDIAKEIGGYRKGYEGSQDYDFILRFSEKVNKTSIKHIPYILYHWRMIETSTAANSAAKPYAYDAAEKSLKDALNRRKYKYLCKRGESFGTFDVNYEIKGNPKVSIIIPTKDKIDFLVKTVLSIEKSDYKNLEIIIVNNNSSTKEAKIYFEKIQGKYKVIDYTEEFNFAKINNIGAKFATGDYLLFLNNDIESISPDWISRLLQYSQFEDVGFVGSLLLYPDKRIQHAGIIINTDSQKISHIFQGFDFQDVSFRGYMNAYDVVREVSAITGACMMVKRMIFDKLHGFDEIFKIDLNDIDICLRAMQLGYSNIINPHSKLFHYESVTRGKTKRISGYTTYSEEKKIFLDRYQNFKDPYLNSNLLKVFPNFIDKI